ncbi:MAG TPA: CBS domain-containing protein [Thermoanaerobaculia bacterium]|nr:CBS domain-containing protein [Thermoanaerobaculia bacterium]
MSANVYTRIAERYQVPPSDDEAVERFFLFIAPMLSDEERAGIVAELVAEEAAGSPVSVTTEVPVEVPTFSIGDAPPVARRETTTYAERVQTILDRLELGLLYVDVGETVRDVVRRMTEAKAGMVAVCHQERLVGVLSEHDVITRVVAEGLNPDDTSVASVMTRVN